MLITDVQAHHIRIPYDAGVASFKLGAAASRPSISCSSRSRPTLGSPAGVMLGATSARARPRPPASEMIARRPAGSRCRCRRHSRLHGARQRNLHLFGRYGITMFAISGLDIALWDLAAKAQGAPLHRLLGARQRARIGLRQPAADRRTRVRG